MRTQNSLISCDFNKNSNSNSEKIQNFEKLENDDKHLVSFYSDKTNSLNPLITIWKDPTNNNRSIQIFDTEKNPIRIFDSKKQIFSVSKIDKIGSSFMATDFQGCSLIDYRMPKLSPLIDFSRKDRELDLVHEGFKQGRMLNFVSNNGITCFDIRNPGEIVLEIEHFSLQPPSVAVPVQNALDWEIDDIYNIEKFPDFEKKFESLISENFKNNFSGEDEVLDIFRSGFGLFSPAHAGDLFFLNNFQPLRKDVDIQNIFNYEVIKEINNSLTNVTLFDGLTRFRKWPTKLYSSNYESDTNRMRGAQFLKFENSVLCFSVDNFDSLCFQALSKDNQNRIIHSRVSIDEAKEREEMRMEENFLVEKSKKNEFLDFEELDELEEIKNTQGYKELIDMRTDAKSIVRGDFFLKEMNEEEKNELQKIKNLQKQMTLEAKRQTRDAAHSGEFQGLGKRNLSELKLLTNDKFYLTKGLMDFYRENWSNEN